MKVMDFFRENNFPIPEGLRESATVCYQGTDKHVCYFRLPKEVDKFNYMTISLRALEAVEAEETRLRDLEVSYDEQFGWKAQMPDSTKLRTDLKW